MDLSTLSDVELTKRYLEIVKATPAPRKALAALEAEAALRGPERMADARRTLGDERESARQSRSCTVCGACDPIAAYGGWCCARVFQ